MDYREIILGMHEEANNNLRKLSEHIDKYLIPQELEKKTNAEISTPYKLRQEMLDKIPSEFWSSPKKVFEPCSGKGGFVIDIVHRFMEGMKEDVVDEKERYKIVVEECLYFSDINPTNIFICKLLLDPYSEYSLKYNEGDTLELDIREKWDIEGFDAVIGNPPYNLPNSVGTGNSIWQHFITLGFDILREGGYLMLVHPSTWRKPESEKSKLNGFFELMTRRNSMLYLEIHNSKDGMKIFKCATRYDWYLIQKIVPLENFMTTVKGEDGIVEEMELSCWKFLPNNDFNFMRRLLCEGVEESCGLIYNRSNYGTDRKWVSKTETDEFCYPLINAITQKEIKYYYSKDNTKGHFGVQKIIFSTSGLNEPLLDEEGKYGMTEHAMALLFMNEEEKNGIMNCLNSCKFKNLLKTSCLWSSFLIDWRLFTYFKKEFWREFEE
jgi:hypothetical protein